MWPPARPADRRRLVWLQRDGIGPRRVRHQLREVAVPAAVVQPGVALVRDRPPAVGQLDDAAGIGPAHPLVAGAQRPARDDRIVVPVPDQPVPAHGELVVDLVGVLVVHLQEQQVQVLAPRVARIIGAVEGDVRLVLRGRVDHQLGRRPVEEVAGAHQPDRAAADRALRDPGADSPRRLGVAAVHAYIVEVSIGGRVVLGAVAAVGRERRRRPLDPLPVQPVGRDPGDHPVAHLRLRPAIVGAALLHRLLARLALAARQLLAGHRVEVAALLAEPLVALLGRRLGIEQDAAGRPVGEDVVGDRPARLHLTERRAVELVTVGAARQTNRPVPAGIDDAVATVLLVPPRRRRLHVGGILPGFLHD